MQMISLFFDSPFHREVAAPSDLLNHKCMHSGETESDFYWTFRRDREEIEGNCSPLIQAPKTQQQFQSQLLRHDASFTFGCGDSNRLLLILSLRLSFFASFVQSGSTAREFMT